MKSTTIAPDSELEAPPPRKRVTFDPTYNLGHVLTFAGFMITIMAGWQAMDKRLTVVEQRTVVIEQRSTEQEMRLKESLGELKSDVRDIKRSVDEIARGDRKLGR